MSTLVKIVRESGIDGRILHAHGGSDFHPAHRKHSGARGPAADAHEREEAAKPTNAKAVLVTAELRTDYANALKGVEQAPWAAVWAATKASRKLPAPVTPEVDGTPVGDGAVISA